MNFLQRYSSPGYGENRIGIQPDFFPMLAYSPTGAHSLSFRQMCAYIRVRVRASATLAGDTYLKSVILQGNDGEVLAGEGIRVAVAAADDASLNIRTGDPVLSVDASEQTYSAVALDLTDPDQRRARRTAVCSRRANSRSSTSPCLRRISRRGAN